MLKNVHLLILWYDFINVSIIKSFHQFCWDHTDQFLWRILIPPQQALGLHFKSLNSPVLLICYICTPSIYAHVNADPWLIDYILKNLLYYQVVNQLLVQRQTRPPPKTSKLKVLHCISSYPYDYYNIRNLFHFCNIIVYDLLQTRYKAMSSNSSVSHCLSLFISLFN